MQGEAAVDLGGVGGDAVLNHAHGADEFLVEEAVGEGEDLVASQAGQLAGGVDVAFGVVLGGRSPTADDGLGRVNVVLLVVAGHDYEGCSVAIGHFAELTKLWVSAVAFFAHEGNGSAFADVEGVVVAESAGDEGYSGFHFFVMVKG